MYHFPFMILFCNVLPEIYVVKTYAKQSTKYVENTFN
jgi:hypothetical protein